MTTIHGKQFKESAEGEYTEFDSTVHGAPEPNDPCNGKLYEFSIAPKDQDYEEIQDRSRLLVKKWHKHMFDLFGDIATYDMVPETSVPKYLRGVPGVLPRVHFHGTIKFTGDQAGIAEFLNNRWHKLLDFATFKLSDYRLDVWPAYISKQRYLQEPYFGKDYHIVNPLASIRSLSEAERSERADHSDEGESEAAKHRGELPAARKGKLRAARSRGPRLVM